VIPLCPPVLSRSLLDHNSLQSFQGLRSRNRQSHARPRDHQQSRILISLSLGQILAQTRRHKSSALPCTSRWRATNRELHRIRFPIMILHFRWRSLPEIPLPHRCSNAAHTHAANPHARQRNHCLHFRLTRRPNRAPTGLPPNVPTQLPAARRTHTAPRSCNKN